MSAYPSLPQHDSTKVVIDYGIKVARSYNGTARVHHTYAAPVYGFTVVHRGLSDADKAVLQTHFDTNAAAPFPFTYAGDNSVYNVVYATAPTFNRRAPGWWDATIQLVTV